MDLNFNWNKFQFGTNNDASWLEEDEDKEEKGGEEALHTTKELSLFEKKVVMDQKTDWPTNQPNDQPTNQPTKWSTKWLTPQPTDWQTLL